MNIVNTEKQCYSQGKLQAFVSHRLEPGLILRQEYSTNVENTHHYAETAQTIRRKLHYFPLFIGK